MIENKIKSRRDYKIYSNSIGFEYFLNFLDHFDVSVEILNSTKEADFQDESTEDLISIIHHFSMKMYSARRRELNKFKKTLEEA